MSTIAIYLIVLMFFLLLVDIDETQQKGTDCEITLILSSSLLRKMSEELSLNDMVMPKCYTRVVGVFDYKIDDLEKPLLEFLEKYCPTAFCQIVYDDTKPNYARLKESTLSPSRIFSRSEQPDTPVAHYINCSFQDLDVFPYSTIPTDISPLFFLHQITVRDGTLLAFGIHHHFTDGHGLFRLLHQFSRWTRDRDDSKIKPLIFDRSLLKPAADVCYEHAEYTTTPETPNFSELPAMDVLVKNYTKVQLFDKLKITTKTLSFNDVLVAWLTQLISQIRQVPSSETIQVGMASNSRDAFGVGPDYFGNCNFYISFQMKMSDLLNKSVNEIAEQINAEKKQYMSKDYMTSALAWIKRASVPVSMSLNSFLGPDLAFTNWSRFPVYQLDFGHGPPRRVSLPPARWDGLVLILPSPTEEVELYIGLKQKHADELLRRIEF